MSNNKQIEKPLELPHQETIVGTNTIQTKPFDNQKTMSNNEFSSVEWLYNKMVLKLCNKLQTIEYTHIFLEEFEQAKAMHKDEIDYKIKKAIEKFEEAKNKASTLRDMVYLDGVLSILYTIKNETFGGNNDQQ